jgi:hypothetical protein
MGGGRRVVTQKEQNAEYLNDYADFIKYIKHFDLDKQEIELKEESVEAAYQVLSQEIIRNLDYDNLIKLKLLKIIFESDDVDKMLKFNLKRIRWMIGNDYEIGFTLDKLENLIKRSASNSLEYAKNIGDRFEKGEKVLAKSDEIRFAPKGHSFSILCLPALEYAKIIGKRFELGEEKIAKKTEYIHEYSKVVGMLPEELHNILIASCL